MRILALSIALLACAGAAHSAPPPLRGTIVYEDPPEGGLRAFTPQGHDRVVVSAVFSGPDVDWPEEPTLDPQGRTVAFEWNFGDPGTRICVAAVAATRQPKHCLTPARHRLLSVTPRWSPDGRRIAYVRIDGDDASLMVVDRDGTHERRLAALRPPTRIRARPDQALGAQPWAPDSKRLTYTSAADVYTIDVASRRTTRLTRGDILDSYPTWSSDGRKVAWVREGSVWVMRPDGSHAHRISYIPGRRMGGPRWSVDGRLAFVAVSRLPFLEGTQAYVTEQSEWRPRLVSGALKVGPNVTWSPDGSAVVFAAQRGHEAARYRIARAGDLRVFGPAREMCCTVDWK